MTMALLKDEYHTSIKLLWFDDILNTLVEAESISSVLLSVSFRYSSSKFAFRIKLQT